MTDAELELALAAQQAELEAKVALADHEVAYRDAREKLIAQVAAASMARQAALAAILQARGMDLREWTLNVATQSFERLGGAPLESLEAMREVLLDQGRPFQPVSSEDELARGRGQAVASVRLTRPGNGGSDEAH